MRSGIGSLTPVATLRPLDGPTATTSVIWATGYWRSAASRLLGKESGVETKMPFTVVAEVSNGLVTHFVDYGDREKALEAAGLRGVGDVAGERGVGATDVRGLPIR